MIGKDQSNVTNTKISSRSYINDDFVYGMGELHDGCHHVDSMSENSNTASDSDTGD